MAGRTTRSSRPASSNRHSSTRSATREKTAKFVPSPSYVAPSGYSSPDVMAWVVPISVVMSVRLVGSHGRGVRRTDASVFLIPDGGRL
jgi:hypothetical protein